MSELPTFEFIECDACREKPGSPILCNSCLNNRAAIGSLKRRNKTYAKNRALEVIQAMGMEDWSILPRLEELNQLAKDK